MTASEYKKQGERLEKYKRAENRISDISRIKSAISAGIISIDCACNREILFDNFGEEFKDKLSKTIIELLDLEIENTEKYMEDI